MLVRKKDSTNSSKEIVKVSSRLATIPGSTIGKVTRQKVIQAFSPRSSAASSRLRSKPSIREISTNIAKGVHNSMCEKPTVHNERGIPTCVIRISSEIARIISGITSGTMMKPMTGPRPGNR